METQPAAITPPIPTIQERLVSGVSDRWVPTLAKAVAFGAAVGIAMEAALQPAALPAGQSYRTVGDTGFVIGLTLSVLFIGIAQGLALRKELPPWFRASLVGAIIGLALPLATGDYLGNPAPATHGGPLGTATGMFGDYAGPLLVFGLVLGLAQWLALRPLVHRAWLWIPVNAFALAVAMPIGNLLGLALGWPLAMLTYGLDAVLGASEGGGLLGGLALVFVGLLMYGLVVAIVTKFFLRRLLRSTLQGVGASESVPAVAE